MVTQHQFCATDVSSGIWQSQTAQKPHPTSTCTCGSSGKAARRQWQIAMGLSLAAPDRGMNNEGIH